VIVAARLFVRLATQEDGTSLSIEDPSGGPPGGQGPPAAAICNPRQQRTKDFLVRVR
jgi:hypothetical protein